MEWGDFVKDYLRFSKRDRIGAIVLIVCIIVVFISPHFFPNNTITPIPVTDSLLLASLDSTRSSVGENSNPTDKGSYGRNPNSKAQSYSLFYFDPNTISSEEWKRLGLRDRTIQTILNYRNKGGKFRTATDLQRIYGLRTAEYNRLKDLIRIKTVSPSSQKKYDPPNLVIAPVARTSFHSRVTIVDINNSDTTAWIALPGIGSKLASRVINFRDKLGGFYSIDQVKETFGLPDSTFQKIRPLLKYSDVEIKRMNVNNASAEELKNHPYIRWQLANAIIAYRNEHGAFNKLEDLKNIMAIPNDVYEKIRHYLTVN